MGNCDILLYDGLAPYPGGGGGGGVAILPVVPATETGLISSRVDH